MAGGQEERPPSPKRDGGHQQRGRPVAGHRPLPSPVALELAPHPRDPVPVPAADSAAFIFLPPTLSLVHPALHLPAWILILLLTPASNSVSLLTAAYPFPPNGDNHVTCRQSTAGRGPPSLCRRHPRHPEQGGGAPQNTAPCRSQNRAAAWSGKVLHTGIPRPCHRRRRLGGGGGAAEVAWCGGSGRRVSHGGDNDTLLGMLSCRVLCL